MISERIYRSLPFVINLSSRIKRAMKADYPNVVLADKNMRTVGGFFTNTKDEIHTDMQNNIIYSIPCKDCNAKYVGYTTRHFKQRKYEHKNSEARLEKILDGNTDPSKTADALERMKEKTALLQHCIEQQHRFAIEDAAILDHHRRKSALPVLEVCHIVNTDHTVNKRTDTDRLSSTYAGILHTVKKIKSTHTSNPNPQTQTNSMHHTSSILSNL